MVLFMMPLYATDYRDLLQSKAAGVKSRHFAILPSIICERKSRLMMPNRISGTTNKTSAGRWIPVYLVEDSRGSKAKLSPSTCRITEYRIVPER